VVLAAAKAMEVLLHLEQVQLAKAITVAQALLVVLVVEVGQAQ
jgi:hypothetical protein